MYDISQQYSELYKSALLQDVIPFWEAHSPDIEYGGYFSCLDKKGQIYDTDKFLWLQSRQAWTFSMLYYNVEPNDRWVQIAKLGIDFIRKYGMDTDGNFYFALTREGNPLVKPYNIFSDCFAAMAFAQYAKASDDKEIKTLAEKTYSNILKRKDHPKGIYEKRTDTRPLRSFALPMILSNLVLEMEDILSDEEVENTLDFTVNEVMELFLQESSGLVHEFVMPDGSLHDSFDGRLLNPGHAIEAMGFMIDIGMRRNDRNLIKRASDTVIRTLEYSWDRDYGGIFYFMDARDYPLQQLEHDQKLWWVHLETLVALGKAYENNPSDEIWEWYTRVHEYTLAHFPDPEYGEWFGYLNRHGLPHLTLKGGKWKGCFHLPRALYQCWKTFERIEEKNKKHDL